MNEELKKFWEKCGFKHYHHPIPNLPYSKKRWEYPDGSYHDKPPEPTLDNLFKYAVPLVIQHYKDKECPGYGCPPEPFFERWVERFLQGEDHAQALLKACMEAILI